MDFLYISPEFPPNYANFVRCLDRIDISVWGVGEADYHSMPESLRAALKWYVRTDLNSAVAVERAVEELIRAKTAANTPPRFDLVESHNENWLGLEAILNEKYDIDGIRPTDLYRLKKKSAMKGVFREAGLPVARGERVRDGDHGIRLAEEIGFPLILKPDEGVGAGGIHKVTDASQLTRLLDSLDGDYVMEEYIDLGIVTFDGLVDREGRLLFENSLVYGDGVLEYVLGKDTFFYVRREIPEPLAEIGRRLTDLFHIRRKFFHFEFFQDGDRYIPIEINCRPPGGPIIDMMNYSVDDDLYDAYARMVAGVDAAVATLKKYHCAYIGRRDRGYLVGHGEILSRYGEHLVEHGENPMVFRGAMGDYRYILRTGSEADLIRMAQEILTQT